VRQDSPDGITAVTADGGALKLTQDALVLLLITSEDSDRSPGLSQAHGDTAADTAVAASAKSRKKTALS
jgi:hypothetical protein